MWLTNDVKNLAAIEELETASDRAAGVIAGAIVDSELTQAIREALSRDDTDYSKKVRHQVFNPDGPLGNFGAKIGLGYLMGYYSQDAHADLTNFKNIRNYFAHYSEHNSFETQKISDLCRNFRLVDVHVGQQIRFEKKDGSASFQHDAMMLKESKIYLCIASFPAGKGNPRWRFLTTAKLICAAFHAIKHQSDKLTEPPI